MQDELTPRQRDILRRVVEEYVATGLPVGSKSVVERALQATTEMLSRVTSLLALVSAPPLEAATVRHAEVLLLQPQVVVVVVITSAGDVSKRVVTFEQPVDSGLVTWAAEYLGECVA